MDIDTIITLVAAVAPSVIAIGTAIGTLLKIIKDFNELKSYVKETAEYKELQDKFNLIMQENLNLKKDINELVSYVKQHPVIKSKED